MAYYLVKAKLITENRPQLVEELNQRVYLSIRPFGIELTKALSKARKIDDNTLVWEEEDYCIPPLKEERAAVLDKYFTEITVEEVDEIGMGWNTIQSLPRFFTEVEIYLDPKEPTHYGIPEE